MGGTKNISAWCDTHLCSRFNNLTGDDLCNLRGGVLHKGKFEHQKAQFNRVMFIGPKSQIKVVRDIIITVAPDVKFGGVPVADMRLAGKILEVDLIYFCQSIMQAARNWAIANANTPNVQRNLPISFAMDRKGSHRFLLGFLP